MKYFLPLDITFNSNNIDYSLDPAEWDSATNYVVDDEVRVSSLEKVYVAVAANNNEYPPDNLYDGSTGSWLEVGVTNKMKMIDDKVNTQSVATNSSVDGDGNTVYDITVEFDTNQVANALALFNIDAHEIYIKQVDKNTESVVFEKTYDLSADEIISWSEYFFSDFTYKSDFYTDTYFYNSVITLKISKKSAKSKAGVIAYGRTRELGLTLYSPEIGIIDFSKKQTDSFGNTYLQQGNYAKTNSYDVLMRAETTSIVYKNLAVLRGKPAVYIGNSEVGALILYGFYRDFTIYMTNYKTSRCGLEIEGLI